MRIFGPVDEPDELPLDDGDRAELEGHPLALERPWPIPVGRYLELASLAPGERLDRMTGEIVYSAAWQGAA